MSSAGQRTDIRGGDRVTVRDRVAVVQRCERTHDKAAPRGRRAFVVKFEDTGELARVSRSMIRT